jgi:hypothetical protein
MVKLRWKGASGDADYFLRGTARLDVGISNASLFHIGFAGDYSAFSKFLAMVYDGG